MCLLLVIESLWFSHLHPFTSRHSHLQPIYVCTETWYCLYRLCCSKPTFLRRCCVFFATLPVAQKVLSCMKWWEHLPCCFSLCGGGDRRRGRAGDAVFTDVLFKSCQRANAVSLRSERRSSPCSSIHPLHTQRRSPDWTEKSRTESTSLLRAAPRWSHRRPRRLVTSDPGKPCPHIAFCSVCAGRTRPSALRLTCTRILGSIVFATVNFTWIQSSNAQRCGEAPVHGAPLCPPPPPAPTRALWERAAVLPYLPSFLNEL